MNKRAKHQALKPRHYAKIARELGYPEQVAKAIEKERDEHIITRILITARKAAMS